MNNKELIAKYKRYLANAISVRDSSSEPRTPGTTKAVVAQIPEYETIIAALEAADKQGEPVAWTHASYLHEGVNHIECMRKPHPSFPVALYTHPQPDRTEIGDEPTEGQYQHMYFAQCDATDVWAKKYHEELDRKADTTLLERCEELEKIAAHANKLAADESEKVIALRFEITSLKVTIGHLYDKYNAWPVGL